MRDIERGMHPDAAQDDFVYYLHRGTSALLQDRVGDAKLELERALQLQPRDAKSQDLLAGVYYRLGLYPRAIELWSKLVATNPQEPTLRVNLALVLFKTGQASRAREHIDVALSVQPDHKRAWGYLGLIHWREGHIEAALDAFQRGGQTAMARRMEEALLRTTPGTVEAPPTEHLDEHDREAMRGAAEAALEQLGRGGLLEIAHSRPSGQSGAWEAVEPGEESVPAPPRTPIAHRELGPRSLATQLAAWTVRIAEGHSMVEVAGDLHVRSRTDVCARLGAVTAVRGNMEAHRLPRPDGVGFLGGDLDGLWQVAGPVEMILRCDAAVVRAIDLEGETLFIEEGRVLAFDTRLRHRVADVPLGRSRGTVLQLQGEGTLALRLAKEPSALLLSAGEELRVDPSRLVGWSGRVFPTAARGTSPYSITAPRLVLRGEGVVLLD